jgi:hypothetical protein
MIVSYELELAQIKVTKVHNADENQQKAISWIFNHIPWLFDLAGGINSAVEILETSYKRKELKS